MSLNHEDIYKVIYFSNIFIVLFRSERESPSTALETNYPLIKYLKINYYKKYKFLLGK